MTKRYGPHCFWDTFGEHFPSQMHSIIYAKVDVERVWNFMKKCFENDAKTRCKIDDKSMNFRNLRFLDFCEEYNVKIIFLRDLGHQKSIKNHSTINAKSMLEKGMHKS